MGKGIEKQMDATERKMTKIAREVNKLTIRVMRGSGIGTGEFDLIHTVRHHPGISQKEISSLTGMDKGAVARRVASLEQKGYLVRKTNPSDARSQFLYATEQAKQLRDNKASVEAVFYEWLLEELSEDEALKFTRILDKLYLRSKKESRGGFIHVLKRFKEQRLSEDGKTKDETGEISYEL